METSGAHDISLNVTIPLNPGATGSDCASECKPWGAPDKLPAAVEILKGTAALLKLLQQAQLEGQLTQAGLCELESLQRFYSALKLQVDKGG